MILYSYQLKTTSMKKLLLSGLAFLIITQLNAQNYQVTFTATGASTTVTTVTVENLTSRTSITLNGTDILNLTITTGITSPEYNQSSDLKIYPNPMNDYTTLEVFPPFEGNASIVISEMTGKPVARKQVYLEKNGEGFKLSGLKSGFYFVNIIGNGFQFSGKLVSNGNATGNINIENAGRIIQTIEKKEVTKGNKGLEATVDMAYTTGDRLKFTGTSGNYKTIITDVPASNKTINFNFVACRDADFNIYPVVAIGTQVWMAENLKTTKYNDGTTAITNVTDNTTWAGLPTGAYCDYSNTPTYSRDLPGWSSSNRRKAERNRYNSLVKSQYSYQRNGIYSSSRRLPKREWSIRTHGLQWLLVDIH